MPEIVVLGATGYTGRLVTRYLSNHPQRSLFFLAIAGRSRSKLSQLKTELNLDDSIETIEIDVLNYEDVERVVRPAEVIINVVGPYWKWGTKVLKACALHGKRYVDLTGEAPWYRQMIYRFDFIASKTGAIIIPSCGFDSIPSDIAVFLSNKTLKALVGEDVQIDESVSAVDVKAGMSGGTLSSVMTMIEEVPRHLIKESQADFGLSTAVRGIPSPAPRLIYTLPQSDPPVYGGLWVMARYNKLVVQRTWGLHNLSGNKQLSYGPNFKYIEFMVRPTKVKAFALSVVVALSSLALFLAPVRWLLKKLLPPGSGPSDEALPKGHLELTNVTSSVPEVKAPRTHVRTVIRGRGDPGYYLTAVMLSESGLALLLDKDKLPPLSREGGIHTPMSALGEVLIGRLRDSKLFEFESEVVLNEGAEARKTR